MFCQIKFGICLEPSPWENWRQACRTRGVLCHGPWGDLQIYTDLIEFFGSLVSFCCTIQALTGLNLENVDCDHHLDAAEQAWNHACHVPGFLNTALNAA